MESGLRLCCLHAKMARLSSDVALKLTVFRQFHQIIWLKLVLYISIYDTIKQIFHKGYRTVNKVFSCLFDKIKVFSPNSTKGAKLNLIYKYLLCSIQFKILMTNTNTVCWSK